VEGIDYIVVSIRLGS